MEFQIKPWNDVLSNFKLQSAHYISFSVIVRRFYKWTLTLFKTHWNSFCSFKTNAHNISSINHTSCLQSDTRHTIFSNANQWPTHLHVTNLGSPQFYICQKASCDIISNCLLQIESMIIIHNLHFEPFASFENRWCLWTYWEYNT